MTRRCHDRLMKHDDSWPGDLSRALAFVLAPLLATFVAACAIRGPEGRSAASLALAPADAVGVWSLTDDENVTFDVRLATDGRASSNWSKGPAGAAGEAGRWSIEGRRIVVDYADGWRDAIIAIDDGRFAKESFAPSADRNGPPTNRGQAARTPPELAAWVGVYAGEVRAVGSGGSDAARPERVTFALQSSQVAWRSGSEPRLGCWWKAGDGVAIRWADGSILDLHRDDSSLRPEDHAMPREAGAFSLRGWTRDAALGPEGAPPSAPPARRGGAQRPF